MTSFFGQYLQEIRIPNEHLCRDNEPIRTVIYGLEGTDKNLTKFRGAARLEQTLETENSSEAPYVTLTVIYPEADDVPAVS